MAKKDIASVLAFEKKLVPSDGYLYGTDWQSRDQADKATPLKLQEKSVRGTISNRLKPAIQNDPAKLNGEVEKPNLQQIDACSLEPGQDALKLSFTLKVLGGVHQPSACNNAVFKESYSKAAKSYIAKTQFTELASRYAVNIANARFLWRNRLGAENIEVQIKALNAGNEQEWVFDASRYNIRTFDIPEDQNIKALAERIAHALKSDHDFLMLDITCFAQIGKAQEVYPSEELVLDKGKGKKSKILYSVDGIAAIHSQKLGNALRTIDTWYPDFEPDKGAGPIAIEPYGAVTNLGKAFRAPIDKKDFYTLFDKWAQGEALDCDEDKHYVMAVLVRGGVFGESDKD